MSAWDALWNDWHPGVLAFVLACMGLYAQAVGPWRQRFGWGPPVPVRQRAAFLAGLALIYIAEGTPIHELSENYLFSVHMFQHALLTTLMPPLLLAGTPAWFFRWLAGRPWLLRAARVLTHPVPALLLFNLIYSFWHIPRLYDWALWVHQVHMLQHAVLVPTAILMWWPVLSPTPLLPRVADAAAIVYFFLISVAQLAVFAVVTFADEAFYSRYILAPRIWGISPETDQQIAGVVMKLSGMLVFSYFVGSLFFRWARQEEAREVYRQEATPAQAGGQAQ